MDQTTKKIEEVVNNLFIKLKGIEEQVKEQEESITKQKSGLFEMMEANSELIKATRATRTAVELLRDEIDEMHQVMVELFKAGKKQQ
jgi:uncharacterized phage infection (PIP) family protein YhgE